jgi:hypothetical protein
MLSTAINSNSFFITYPPLNRSLAHSTTFDSVIVGAFGRGLTVIESSHLACAATTVFEEMFDNELSTPSERMDLIPALTLPGVLQKMYSNGVAGKLIAVALGRPEGASAI